MNYYSVESTNLRVFTVPPVCFGISIAICVSSPAWAAHSDLGGAGQTLLQQNTGDSVSITCAGLKSAGADTESVPLFATCSALVQEAEVRGRGNLGLTDDELAASLQQVATEEFAATESLATEITTNNSGNVMTRLVELRRNVRGFSMAGLDYPGKAQTIAADTLGFDQVAGHRGGAAGAEEPSGKLGAFINGSYSTGDRDGTVRTDEFDFDSYGLTSGIDYRFRDNLVLGAAISYFDVDADFDEKPTVSGGGVDADGWGGFVYGTWYSDRFYVDGLAGYAKTSYDTKRSILIPDNSVPSQTISETAKGDPDSDDYTLSVGAGYSLDKGALNFGPYTRVSYYKVDIDGYRENGAEASGLNLDVDGQDWESLTSVVGAQFSYAFSQSFGVLIPQGQVGWVHEYENDAEQFSAVFVDDPNQNKLLAETDDPDRDYFELGFGVSAVFKRGTQAFIYYDTVLGLDDVTNHIITVGGRMEF